MKNNMGNECISVIRQFLDKRTSDPDFYFAIELDSTRTIRSIFWADGRSRASFLKFSDVVVFDVTYRTNKLALYSPRYWTCVFLRGIWLKFLDSCESFLC